MIKLSPSILSADFANLERDVRVIADAGCDYVHVDVMDGHFVPNITIGAPVVKALRRSTMKRTAIRARSCGTSVQPVCVQAFPSSLRRRWRCSSPSCRNWIWR